MSEIFGKMNTGKTSIEGDYEVTEVKNKAGKVVGKLKQKLPFHHKFKNIEGQEFTDQEARSFVDFYDNIRTNFDQDIWSDEEIAEEWFDEINDSEMRAKENFLGMLMFVVGSLPVDQLGKIILLDIDERIIKIAKSRSHQDIIGDRTVLTEEEFKNGEEY